MNLLKDTVYMQTTRTKYTAQTIVILFASLSDTLLAESRDASDNANNAAVASMNL